MVLIAAAAAAAAAATICPLVQLLYGAMALRWTV
jgi:hypothetical protein